MSETNKAILRRVYEEVFGRGSLAAVDETVAADFVGHQSAGAGGPGREGVKKVVTALRNSFPDIEVQVEELLAVGDKVVGRWKLTGTQAKDYMGSAPTGKPVTITTIDISRVVDGKLQEVWALNDFLQQVQAMPGAGQLEENKAIVRRWTEETWNGGNLSVIDEIVSTDYVLYNPPAPETRGIKAIKENAKELHVAFPDGRFTTDSMIAVDDMVVHRWTFSGTHRGDWFGVAATGRWVRITGTSNHRLAAGKFERTWNNVDLLGMMQQLGAVPEFAQVVD
jgi:predicted ester cyclase